MGKKKSLLTLVLESYQSACRMMAGLKGDDKNALNSLTSGLIKTSYLMTLSMFRNVLMDAELGPGELAEVEGVLKTVTTEHTNEEVLNSVRRIRAELHVLQA